METVNEIRKVRPDEVDAALALVWEVFTQFEAPDYGPVGTDNFRLDVIENLIFREKCAAGAIPMFGAFSGGEIVGVMALREGRTHIMLAFVKKDFHRRGIASALFRAMVADRLEENPALTTITVNSSPCAVGFYHKLGFTDTDEQQTKNGIRYTPMIYHVNE